MYQDRWDKTRILIADLQDMEAKGRYGIDTDSMDYIKGFLIYLAWKYRDVSPYLKCLHPTLIVGDTSYIKRVIIWG